MSKSIKNLEWRYAVKKFDAFKTVSPKKIEILKQAFNLTATSYGLQPITLVIVQNKEFQQRLLPFTYNQDQVVQASHVLVFCIQKNISTAYINAYFDRVAKIRSTEERILEPYRTALIADFAKKTKDDIAQWATQQAYLAMGNLLTICAQERIDACPMEGFIPEKYATVLHLDTKELHPVLVMPIGYRAEDDLFSDLKKVRKKVTESVIEMY
ncbi:NAD(P)H-dependent oxidoreductase [Arenibacter sp. GZD96]|uniref:NAD(P)H-dependent oxidoreductase n=1 Tax=Aurantibrevibacter litoralis TaxID=3106030 RepID=UPI002AFFC59A|nr:NAD(P)H-dependent oxidoreductase [Arenibacter sp. GZD-96]MEA1786301.1 NAD(P)H-dependent oxidoreductase [Arenibacter sp. GZD-96]